MIGLIPRGYAPVGNEECMNDYKIGGRGWIWNDRNKLVEAVITKVNYTLAGCQISYDEVSTCFMGDTQNFFLTREDALVYMVERLTRQVFPERY